MEPVIANHAETLMFSWNTLWETVLLNNKSSFPKFPKGAQMSQQGAQWHQAGDSSSRILRKIDSHQEAGAKQTKKLQGQVVTVLQTPKGVHLLGPKAETVPGQAEL